MKAVILAAGRGTRLQPVTLDKSKCMLPIAGKPILEHIIKAVKSVKIKDIVLIVGYKEEKITEYFQDGSGIGVNIEYITQKKRLGTAHAIDLARTDEKILVLNGDTIMSKKSLEDVLDVKDSTATLGLKRVKDPRGYGVVKLDGDRVKSIIEKPTEFISDLANTGTYVFSPKIFDAIKKTKKSKRGEYEITDSIEILIKEGEDVKGIEIGGLWSDIGNPWNYLDSNQEILKDIKDEIHGEIEDFVKINGNIYLGHNSVIKSGTYIEGPAYIGDNTIVGPNTFIRSFTSIGDKCHIGNSVELKNSIIMNHTNVPHLSYVGDSIIGSRCNFGAGTLVGNLRLDEKSIKMRIKGELMDTGRRKMGCVVGDNVKTGLNVMINSGRKIGSNSMIGPGVVVYSDVAENSFVVQKQTLEIKVKKR